VVAAECEIVERNGYINGHPSGSVIEDPAAYATASIVEQTVRQPVWNDSASGSANRIAEAPPEARSTSGAEAEAKPDGNDGTASTRPTKPAAGKRTKKSAPAASTVNYVSQAELNAEQEKLEGLSRDALAGDTAAIDRLRAALDHCPHIWRRLADLQYIVECKLIQLVAGNDTLRAECFRKRCSELRYELLERKPCSLATEIAASRVVATFMFAQLLELRSLQAPEELRCIKQLEQAERRFHVAMRTFLMAKRSELQLSQTA
jgi:hypothetical protein